MSYQDFLTELKRHSTQLSESLNGNGSAPTFDATIDFARELQAAENASTAEQKVHLSNALYDQIAAARSLRELYKTPAQYFAECRDVLNKSIPEMDAFSKQVEDQHASVVATINKTKVNNVIAKPRPLRTEF